MSLISAVIVNFFSSGLTCRAVESLKEERQGVRCRIWVVDNSCNQEEATRIATLLPSDVELIINGRNVGFGAACNQVFARDEAPYLLLLNPDAALAPRALSTLLDVMEEEQELGAVGPMAFWDDECMFLMPPNIPPLAFRELCLPRDRPFSLPVYLDSLFWRRYILSYWRSSTALTFQPDLCGGHVLLRREAVEEAGGLFDPRFFMYFEDTDLFLRLRKKGWKLAICREARVVHHYNQSGSTRAHRLSKEEFMAASHRLFIQKHFSKSNWLGRLRPLWKLLAARDHIEVVELEAAHRPPELHVESGLRDGWLLEVTPSPAMVPMIGHFGRGERVIWPESVIPCFVPGVYYFRISDPDSFWAPRRILRMEIRNG